jgi:hypothetical protein
MKESVVIEMRRSRTRSAMWHCSDTIWSFIGIAARPSGIPVLQELEIEAENERCTVTAC